MNSFRLLSLAALAGLVFVPLASGQNVTIVSGNGQVLGGTNFLLQPLVVQVTNADGTTASAGVAVNWQGSGFNGYFLESGTQQVTTETDVNGLATAHFSLPFEPYALTFTSPFIQTGVTATAGVNTATFTLTQLVLTVQAGVAPYFIVTQLSPLSSLSGAIGAAGTPIQLQVTVYNAQTAANLPNAEVQLLNFQDPSLGPLVACAGTPSAGTGVNTALTDANGVVTCTPVFGGQPGTGEFVVTIGGVETATSSPAGFWQALLDPTDPTTLPNVQAAWIVNLNPLKINATPGAAGSIKILTPTGGTQSVTGGGAVSLSVETDNAAGLPVAGSTVNWAVVSPSSGATLSTTSSTSDTTGRAVDTVSISSSFSGVVVVSASLAGASGKSVSFTINVTPPVTITQFQTISGANQAAVVNSVFAQPLVVKVSVSAGSPANIPVQFAVLSGSATLSASSVNTDVNGLAQVTVTAGPVTGPVSIAASVSAVGVNTVSFALSVLPAAPQVSSANFVNGADFQANSLSPCGLGAIVTSPGTLSLPSVSSTFPGSPVPGNTVQLTFANLTAPIMSIGTNAGGQQQIVFQVPCELTPAASVPVNLSVGGAHAPVNLNIQTASPGIFQTQMSDGVSRALIVRPDGSFVSLTNPARQGEIVVSYVTGLGAYVTTPGNTTPTLVNTHTIPAPNIVPTVASDEAPSGMVIPGVGGGGATLIYAKLSEELPGVYLVAFQIPSNAPTGNNTTYSISMIPAGASTQVGSATTTIPVSSVQ